MKKRKIKKFEVYLLLFSIVSILIVLMIYTGVL